MHQVACRTHQTLRFCCCVITLIAQYIIALLFDTALIKCCISLQFLCTATMCLYRKFHMLVKEPLDRFIEADYAAALCWW